MRNRLSRLLLGALSFAAMSTGSAALAQTNKPDPRMTIIFEGGDINGQRATPSMSYGVVAKAGPFQCQVRVRKNFLPEAQDSVSNL